MEEEICKSFPKREKGEKGKNKIRQSGFKITHPYSTDKKSENNKKQYHLQKSTKIENTEVDEGSKENEWQLFGWMYGGEEFLIWEQ